MPLVRRWWGSKGCARLRPDQLEVEYEYRANVVLNLGADLFYGNGAGTFGQFGDANRVTAGVEVGL